jgi:thiamine-monophosphate kinase
LKPEARKDIVLQLNEKNFLPTSMIDVSDGLSSELLHLCRQSGVGCKVYEERIPIDYQTALMAEQFNMNVSTVALNGGEDYELLFTLPLSLHEQIEQLEGIKVIGHLCEASSGTHLVARDGTEIALKAQGWNSLEEGITENFRR